jgi:uncharacterized protein
MIKEPLSLHHQKTLSEKFKLLNVRLSEYSFAGLFLFRNIHQYEVIFDNEILIEGVTRDKVLFLMPLFKPAKEHLSFLQSILKKEQILYPIPQEWLSAFDKNNSEITYNEADSDYLFHVNKLAFYPGRHLSKKRNLVKQLMEEHEVKVFELTAQNKQEAINILDAWQNDQQKSTESKKENDYFSCLEAIHLLERLNLKGQLYYVDQEPSGFIIGEWITSDCFDIHFEKAIRTTKGLYQYLLQNFAQTLEKNEAWINLEQDLGSPALRQSKHSYQPDEIVHKMRVFLDETLFI